MSTQDHMTHRNHPTEARLPEARPGYQYEAPPTATPTRDSCNDFTDGGAPKKPQGSKGQSSHPPLHSGGPPSRHPPMSSQRRGSLGGFSDDFASSLPQSSTLPPPKFSSPPGGRGGDEISQSSARYLEVSRSLQEQRVGMKRSSATSESDSNGVAMDPEYQHLLPESSDETVEGGDEEGREEDGERRGFPGSDRSERDRRGEVERRREEGGGAAGRRVLLSYSVPRSSSEVGCAQYLTNTAQENSSKYLGSMQMSASSIHDDLLGVKLRQFQSSTRSELSRKPRKSPEHFEIRRSSSQCQTKQYERMGFGVGLDSRRCHSDSETRAGGERTRHPSRGRLPNLTPPLSPHSIPPPIGHIPMIPAWNSIVHTAPDSISERNRSSFQYRHLSTAPGLSDNLSSRQSEQQSSQHVPSVATGDRHRGRELGERVRERERSRRVRERETEEPMQVSPNTTRSFEMSDEISAISNSAQVGSDTTLIADTNLSVTHSYPSTERRQVMSSSNLSGAESNTFGSKNSQQYESLGRVGGAERRAGSSQGGPQSSMGSVFGDVEMDYEGRTCAGGRKPHQGSEGHHSAIHSAVPSMFPEADIHGTSEGTERSQLFELLAGQLPTDLQQSESGTRSTLQNAPADSSFHQESPHWYGEDSREQESSELPQNAEKTRQTAPPVPMDPAVTTVYSGPHAMSPIPEASQEFSSQATTTTPNHTSSHLHTQFTQSMHSLSPLDEQGEEQTTRQQRSISPFRHNALEETATIARSPTAVSDITTPSNTSQLIAADNRSPTPQIEPPSSDTSRSLTRSLEVDSSTQATIHSPNSQERERDYHFQTRREQETASTRDSPLTRLDGYASFVGAGTQERCMEHHHVTSGEVQQQQHDLLERRDVESTLQEAPQDSASLQDQLRLQHARDTPQPQDTTSTLAADGSDLFTNEGAGETSTERGPPRTAEGDGGVALVHSGAYQSSNVSSEGGSGLRGSTPLSTTSAPPAIAQQGLRGLERSISPGSCVGSSLSDSVAQRQLGRRPVRSRHRTGPLSEREREWSRGRSEAGERGVRRVRGGREGGEGEQRTPQQSERRGRGHQGEAQGTSRIVQDLEMMTRAIDGMDSGRHWEPNQQRRMPQPQEEGRGHSHSIMTPGRGRGPRPASCTSQTAGPPQSRLASDSRQMFRPITPALATGQPRSSSAEPHQRHRISHITNHMTSGHSSTATPTDPRHTGQSRREATLQLNLNFQQVPTLHNSPMDLSQIAPSDDSPEPIRNPILELGTPNLAQSGTPPACHRYHSMLSPPHAPAVTSNNGYQGSSASRQPQRENVPPPQVASDSFDYLPPYSPPRNVRGSQASQRSAILATPQGYPDPPPSYEEIFGQQSQSRGSQRQRHASRYSRGRQEESGGRGSSQSHGDGGHHPSSRSSGQRRLSSLTSLFKRSRRHSHDPGAHHTSHHIPSPRSHPLDQTSTTSGLAEIQGGASQGAVQRVHQDTASTSPRQPLQRTASWVAAYNQTPRPHSVLQQFERSFGDEREGGGDTVSSVSAVSAPTHSVAHSHVSRAASDTAAMNSLLRESHAQTASQSRRRIRLPSNQLPYIPYRHPPPFRSTQSHSQTATSSAHPLSPPPSSLTHSHTRDFNSSQPNITTTTHTASNSRNPSVPTNAHLGHVTPRLLSHHQRLRPSSAVVTSSEFGHIADFHHYPPEQRRRQHRAFISEEVVDSNGLEGPENISNSCFNISSVATSGGGGGGGGGGGRGGWVTGDGSRSHSTRQPPSVQAGVLDSVEEHNLRANGNANNTNSPTTSPGHAGNHTPSPTFTRRACSSQPGPEEWTACSSTQPYLHSQTESRASQTGNGTKRKQGQRSLSQQSTSRSRAVSRRQAQQPQSSDEEEERVSSQSSRGQQRPRLKRGDTSSQSTSQNSPAPSATPIFFPSFQSQTQPEVTFSVLSTDQLIPTPRALRDDGLCNGHVTLGEVSRDHLVTSQPQQSQSQLTQDTLLLPQNTSGDRLAFAGQLHGSSHNQSHDPSRDQSHDQSPDYCAADVAGDPELRVVVSGVSAGEQPLGPSHQEGQAGQGPGQWYLV